MSENIEQFDWTVTEERKAQLSLDNHRLEITHTVTLHRDKQSIGDMQQMLDALISGGAPKEATVTVRTQDPNSERTFSPHIQVHARWNQEATL